jgi:cell division protein FtsB
MHGKWYAAEGFTTKKSNITTCTFRKETPLAAMTLRRVKLFPVIVIILMIIVIGQIVANRLRQDITYLRITVSDAENSQSILNSQTSALENELSSSQTDEYIVDQARRLYGYLMPGEIRFKVSNPEALYGADATILEEGK